MRQIKQNDISIQLPLALRTGKYVVGYKQSLKSLIKEDAKCLIIASNFLKFKRLRLEYYAALANRVPIKIYSGNNRELGALSKLKIRAGVITILDKGESDIINIK